MTLRMKACVRTAVFRRICQETNDSSRAADHCQDDKPNGWFFMIHDPFYAFFDTDLAKVAYR